MGNYGDYANYNKDFNRQMSKYKAIRDGVQWSEEYFEKYHAQSNRAIAEAIARQDAEDAEDAARDARKSRRKACVGRVLSPVGDAIGDFFTNVIYLVRNLAYFALSILCLGGYIMFLCSLYVGFTLVRDCVGGMNIIDAFKAHPCFLPFLLAPIVLQILKGIVDPN